MLPKSQQESRIDRKAPKHNRVNMSETLNRNEDDVPVHDSPVLYFARCGCTYCHTTPHQNPRDDPNPPDSLIREMIPDIDGVGKLKMVRKVYIEGNCRIHDIQMGLGILETDDQPGDNPDEYGSENTLVHLGMVRSTTA
jgi:hypothetical protein